MILVKISTSSSCRGWEENSSSIEEWEGDTLKGYVENWLRDDWDLNDDQVEREMSGQVHEDCCFGMVEGGSESGGYNHEGEECTITFEKFEPSDEFVDMIVRYHQSKK